MIKSTIENMAEPIGFEIGTSDDITQAKLLNGFCKGLDNSIIDRHNKKMQLCYIEDKLTPQAREVLKHLVQFIENK